MARLSKEDKAANKIVEAVSDITLDLQLVGMSMGLEPTVLVERLDTVVESARWTKEKINERIKNNIRE